MSFALTLDRNAEIHVDATIRIKVDEGGAADFVTVLTATCEGFTSTTKGAIHMAYTLPADKLVELRISYQDKNGNPASIDGQVSWDSSDSNVAAISPSPDAPPDNSLVRLTPGASVGTCQISARADADLGAGVRELFTLLDVTVVGGEAVTGTITPGEAIPQPSEQTAAGQQPAASGQQPGAKPRRGF